MRVRLTTTASSCPTCGAESSRIHSHYWRRLADLSCFGQQVGLEVHVRRWRCAHHTCPQRTFAERLPDLARPRAQRTERLCALHRSLALALGGNAGARLSEAMAVPTSGSTLLRMIRDLTGDPPPEPRVLGVDDWAWRKGARYGTLLCDLERGRIIDLLPDRTADTLAAWLRHHPSVQIVVRDRAGASADGTRQGAPQATQVADRWHLLRNGSDALRELLDHHHRDLREAAVAASRAEASALGGAVPDSVKKPDLTKAQRQSLDRLQRREARFAEAVHLREQGLSIRAVARTLGVERNTVRRWLRAGHAPTWRHAAPSRSLLDPFREYLERRWDEGYDNGTGLWREIRARGFTGQASLVRQWAAQRRRQGSPTQTSPASTVSPFKAAQPPTPRRAVRLLLAETDQLTEAERRFVEALLDRSPPLVHAVALIAAFATMIKQRLADNLDDWIEAAEGSELKGFAASLRRDRSAVHAALTLPWSTGPVEGHINRVKVIKREMYGRAGFELLRSRVLAAA